jgi:Rrf2 family protein
MKRLDYGIILIESLKVSGGGFVDIKSIARERKIPEAYLEKIAQEFKRAGWLESRRGFGGGYRLVKNPEEISVSALINFYSRPYEICPINRVAKKV